MHRQHKEHSYKISWLGYVKVVDIFKSEVNSILEHSKDEWIVYMFNTGEKASGHAVIVVEGAREADNQTLVGQYEIRAVDEENQKSSLNTPCARKSVSKSLFFSSGFLISITFSTSELFFEKANNDGLFLGFRALQNL